MAAEATERGTLGTIRNASALLDLLSTGPAYQQLTELSERSGMTLPTVHRLLRSLVAAGLVEQDPASSRYSLGSELVRLSEQYLARLPVLRAVAPYLVELRNATKATVLVALLVRDSVVYVDRIDGEDVGGVFRVSHRVHQAADTAAGRVLLASRDQPGDQREPFVLVSGTDPDEHPEVAVPVVGQRGTALAALAATGNRSSLSPDVLSERVAPQLLRAATAVGRAMSDR